MSQLADCKNVGISMLLISAECRNKSWENKEISLDLVLETIEIFLDYKNIVDVLEEVKAYYLSNTNLDIDTRTRMVEYLDNKLGFYSLIN
jgi:hypothetical protein